MGFITEHTQKSTATSEHDTFDITAANSKFLFCHANVFLHCRLTWKENTSDYCTLEPRSRTISQSHKKCAAIRIPRLLKATWSTNGTLSGNWTVRPLLGSGAHSHPIEGDHLIPAPLSLAVLYNPSQCYRYILNNISLHMFMQIHLLTPQVMWPTIGDQGYLQPVIKVEWPKAAAEGLPAQEYVGHQAIQPLLFPVWQRIKRLGWLSNTCKLPNLAMLVSAHPACCSGMLWVALSARLAYHKVSQGAGWGTASSFLGTSHATSSVLWEWIQELKSLWKQDQEFTGPQQANQWIWEGKTQDFVWGGGRREIDKRSGEDEKFKCKFLAN